MRLAFRTIAAAGVLDPDGQSMNDALGSYNTRSEYFSMAKSVVSLIVGRAVTLGHLSLDDMVVKFLPQADEAHEELFDKVGISRSDWNWERDGAGHTHGWSWLQASGNFAARLGHLTISDGVWNGERLISQAQYEWERDMYRELLPGVSPSK